MLDADGGRKLVMVDGELVDESSAGVPPGAAVVNPATAIQNYQRIIQGLRRDVEMARAGEMRAEEERDRYKRILTRILMMVRRIDG